MKNAVIIHGWGATSQSNWFPWLQEELEKKGFKVTTPDFPNTENPVLTEWLEYFNSQVAVNQETVLVGHSLGVPFILRWLEGVAGDQRVKAAVLVAGFERPLGFPTIDNFVDQAFDWAKIRKSAGKFWVISSDNDPYIPLKIGKDLAASLGVKLVVERGGEHLNAPGGFLAYPRLVKLIAG